MPGFGSSDVSSQPHGYGHHGAHHRDKDRDRSSHGHQLHGAAAAASGISNPVSAAPAPVDSGIFPATLSYIARMERSGAVRKSEADVAAAAAAAAAAAEAASGEAAKKVPGRRVVVVLPWHRVWAAEHRVRPWGWLALAQLPLATGVLPTRSAEGEAALQRRRMPVRTQHRPGLTSPTGATGQLNPYRIDRSNRSTPSTSRDRVRYWIGSGRYSGRHHARAHATAPAHHRRRRQNDCAGPLDHAGERAWACSFRNNYLKPRHFIAGAA